MNRSARARLAEETVGILDKGKYAVPGEGEVDISKSLEECIAGTRQFDPDQLRIIHKAVLSTPGDFHSTAIDVANETTLAGAYRLFRTSSDGRIGVLNFASAKNPGGGFLGGSLAQEESLACNSGLYKSLLNCPEFYNYHRSSGCLLYSHRIIHSPACPVFRDDAGNLLSVPYHVDFFTCPAPNAGAIHRNQPDKTDKIIPVLRERIASLLALALKLEVFDLVLGAWGCGVFGNDPASVARAFRDALTDEECFPGRFRRIRFSVLDRSRDGATFRAFAEMFRQEGQRH